jgi:Leucine-rich repeat (LRR) protein
LAPFLKKARAASSLRGLNTLTDVKGLEKLTLLTHLDLWGNELTNVKGLENLTQLKGLELRGNPALTIAQIARLQKALPNCKIESTATK